VRTPLAEAMIQRRLLVTAGAGGVGKTTCAAALGVEAALAGQRVAVLTIDPARRLAGALGLDALTGTLRQVDGAHFATAGLAPAGELWAMMLDTKTTGDQMVRRFAPDPESAQRILDNTYYRYFSTSLAGSQEYMAVEQVRELVEDDRFDLVILDTPPAANALEFLDAPDRLLAALDSSTVQMLVKGRQRASEGLTGRLLGRGRGLVLKSLNVMTGGPFLEDLAEFLSLFGVILDALKHASVAVQALLRSPDTQFYLVTSPKRSNLDEAMRFRAELARRSFPFGGFIANRVHFEYPAVDTTPEGLRHLQVALAEQTPGADAGTRQRLLERMLGGVEAHNRMALRDARSVAQLTSVAQTAPIEVPLQPLDVRDLGGLHRVGRWLTHSEPRA
jgi:anion-transporting  ArsA/GET3 family ATPase